MAPPLDRERLIADRTLVGRGFCAAYTARIDEWLVEIFNVAAAPPRGIALVAVGGHGRGELTPFSDLDLLLVSDAGAEDGARVADALWYPIWDEGVKLGHAVRSTKETLALAADDLETATALLSLRHLAGDPAVSSALADRAAAQWRKRRRRFTEALAEMVAARHAAAGDVAFDLEPDLKEGRGGLRDVHALGWATALGLDPAEARLDELDGHYDLLLAVRIELHRATARAGDRLVLQEQDAVAERLGLAGADELMLRVATAARAIAWDSDEFWYGVRQTLPGAGHRRAARSVGDGLTSRDGRVALDESVAPGPFDALRVGVAAAEHGLRIAVPTLRRLDEAPAPDQDAVWPDDALSLLVRLLLCGVAAIPVVETLDQAGLWTRLLPEWEHTRSRPQRNAYHRFTVDRHLLEAAAEAAKLATTVQRPDLLVLGALLHDIGKGLPGDHTEVGVEIVVRLGPRLGLSDRDTATIEAMVRHHLLLPDVATRRDLEDPATIAAVAEVVGDVERLELLAALTEADSRATGPSAWGAWKARLVAELADRVRLLLTGEDPSVRPAVVGALDAITVVPGERRVQGVRDQLTVIWPDRPGIFSRVAGVLALHGLDVLEASAGGEDAMAVEVFRVSGAGGGSIRWDRVCADVERALTGRLAISARLAERARTYRPKVSNAHPLPAVIRFDNDATEAATVLEVVGVDRVGLLHEITRALAEFELDIVNAKIATAGTDVVDTFYVRDADGSKILDPDHQDEITRALRHVVGA